MEDIRKYPMTPDEAVYFKDSNDYFDYLEKQALNRFNEWLEDKVKMVSYLRFIENTGIIFIDRKQNDLANELEHERWYKLFERKTRKVNKVMLVKFEEGREWIHLEDSYLIVGDILLRTKDNISFRVIRQENNEYLIVSKSKDNIYSISKGDKFILDTRYNKE